jgi:hypothetical protein
MTGFGSFPRIHPELDAQIPQSQQDTRLVKDERIGLQDAPATAWQPALIFFCLHLLS